MAKYQQKIIQPNFSAAFGREVPSKLRWSVRSDSNRLHDLIYFRSYLHDARISPTQIALHRKILSLRVNRDCWELPMKETKRYRELSIADALVTLSDVSGYLWEFDEEHRVLAHQGKDLWITGIFWDEALQDAEGTCCLVFSGGRKTWKLKVFLDEFATIKLRDLEIPYLWSEKNKEKSKITARSGRVKARR